MYSPFYSPKSSRTKPDSNNIFSRIFQEKQSDQAINTIFSKNSSHITITTPTTQLGSPLSKGSEGNQIIDIATPYLFQITVKQVLEFLEILLNRFKLELAFVVKNATEIDNLHNQSTGNSTPIELTTVKNIISFESFILINKKECPLFYKSDSIINRFHLLISILDETTRKLRRGNLSKSLSFFNETECLECLTKTLPQNSLENEYFLRVCSELWRFIRANPSIPPSENNIQTAFDNLKLFLFGISFPSRYVDDYPLHKAVYYSDLPMIRRICARERSPVFYCHIEQSDPVGVTPLMLAVLLGNKDAALVLVNHGANPKHRSYLHARTPLEEAINKKNRSIIKALLLATRYIKQKMWEENKTALIEFLEKVPDFSLEMNWECDSKIIPFVKKMTPSDTYRVYKRGSAIRIDLSLLGWSKLRSVRGNSSIVFNGSGAEGKLLMIDNVKKTSADMLGEIGNLALENKVDELIKHEQMNSEVRAENVAFEPATNWRGERVDTNVNGYDCTKYIAKGTFSVLFTRRNVLLDVNAKGFKTFEQYFEYTTKEPLWILEDKAGRVNWEQNPLAKVSYYIECYQALVKTLFEKDNKKQFSNTSKDGERVNIAQKKLIKDYTKNIVASVYMSDSLPLKLDHFFPILEILSNVSPHIGKVKGFLERTMTINKNSFPIKACIPIFFSLDAVLAIQEFRFRSPDPLLFNIDTILQRTSTKASDLVFRDERFRTEGPSELENIQLRWRELIKQDSAEEISSGILSRKFVYHEEESEDVESIEIKERNQKIIHSFFKKKRDSDVNTDYIDVFAPDGDTEDQDDDETKDHDTSERKCNDTLKLNSHRTHIPKTLLLIEQKFQLTSSTKDFRGVLGNNADFQRDIMMATEPNDRVASKNRIGEDNINALREDNYKFLRNLNQQPHQTDPQEDRNEYIKLNDINISGNGFRELDENKFRKYTVKKQNIYRVANQQTKMTKEEEKRREPIQKVVDCRNEQKTLKKMKHERIKSLEFPYKNNFETFFERIWAKKDH